MKSPRDIANRSRHLELCREFVQDRLTNQEILVEVGSSGAPFQHLPGLAGGPRISLDVDVAALRTSSEAAHRADILLIAADGHRLPIREDTIDGIVAIFVLEHLQFPGQFLAEARRVLKSGGFVFIVTPNLADPLFFPILLFPPRLRERILQILGGHPNHKYLTYLRANTARRLRSLASGAGFRVARVATLWEDHYFTKLPQGDAILSMIDQKCTGTPLQSFAGRIYALLEKEH